MSTNNNADFTARRLRFRQYESEDAVLAYLQRLETQWPERTTIAQHITAQVAALPQVMLHVLELCCGPGRLAERLLAANPDLRSLSAFIQRVSTVG